MNTLPENAAALAAAIQSKDESIRGQAWQQAPSVGAPAITALTPLLVHEDFEVARAASKAMWLVVRRAGRPEADTERRACVAALLPLLKHAAERVRREALWMLSEVAGEAEVPSIAALLSDRQVREDARAALERIPHSAAVAALQSALSNAQEDYKPALAHSLRARGVVVSDVPDLKLKPKPQSGSSR